MPEAPPKIVYLSFDPYPAPKGAAVHIDAFVDALAAEYGPLDLVTVPPVPVGREEMPTSALRSAGGAVRHFPLPASGANLIERVMHFRREVARWWGHRSPQVIHFRSIFEGYPLVRDGVRRGARLVYEVNGLPSVELKYHYPGVADDRELRRKLEAQEDACLRAADLVITVSPVTAEYLAGRGLPEGKIRVIPNGVDTALWDWKPPAANAEGREMRLLYSGTLSAWQGVHVAVEALAMARRDFPARLTIVGAGRARQRRALHKLAEDLGVADHVEVLAPVDPATLVGLHHDADAVVAPLLANDRNLEQGCCPLKVLEAMASGTPVIASDLPVVRCLARDHVEAVLVRPNSAKAVKDGLLRLHREPELAPAISRAARARVEQRFSWSRAQDLLLAGYAELLESSAPSEG